MAITNLTLLTGATVSITGGTTQNFAPTGTEVTGGIEVQDTASGVAHLTRKKVVARSRMTRLQSDGSYSKMKFGITYIIPMVDSSGKVQNNLVRVEVEKHPEISSADETELLNKAAQLPVDTDLTAFWQTGAKS